MLVRNPLAASAVDEDGTVYSWEPNGDVDVPVEFANALCAIPDAGFVATEDANRDDSDDLVTVNELHRLAGEEPVDGGDKVKRPRRPRKVVDVPAPPAEFSEIDPEATESEVAAGEEPVDASA